MRLEVSPKTKKMVKAGFFLTNGLGWGFFGAIMSACAIEAIPGGKLAKVVLGIPMVMSSSALALAGEIITGDLVINNILDVALVDKEEVTYGGEA